MSVRRWAVLSSAVTALAVVAVVAVMSDDIRGTADRASTAMKPVAEPARDALSAPIPPAATVPVAAQTVLASSATNAASPKLPANIASRLKTLPASTSQVIIVHASTAKTITATLETYRRVTGGWVRQFAAMPARIGKDGFSDHHVEGVPSTPIGMFGFGSTMYGVNANPGVGYTYHRLVTNDWWNESPNSSAYNTFVHSLSNPGGGSEALWKQTVAYQYFAFITYNVPALHGKGSGIFLHENHTSSTSGCVSLPKADLIKVLTWLRPSDNPRIVLSPDGDLGHF